MIGNKLDLENSRRVSREMAAKYSKDNKIDLFMEASAKEGINTQKVFIQAAKILLDDYIKYEKNVKNQENPSVSNNKNNLLKNSDKAKIDNQPKEKSKKGCC